MTEKTKAYVPGAQGHAYVKKKDPHRGRNLTLTVLFFALFAGLMIWYQKNAYDHSYAISIIERSAIYAVGAVAMNLLTGFTGLFSLGQAGFMAIGAYVTGVLTIPVSARQSVYYMTASRPGLKTCTCPWCQP